MQNDAIVKLLRNLTHKNPSLKQEIVDLCTLSFREGMMAQKILEIADMDGRDPMDVIPEDIMEDELQEIVYEAESFYELLANIVTQPPMKPLPVNRVGLTLDEMAREFPGLF